MNHTVFAAAAAVSCAAASAVVHADVVMYEMDNGEHQAFLDHAAQVGLPAGSFDLDELQFQGATPIDDPLDSGGDAGAGIPPNFIPQGVVLQSDMGGGLPRGANGMVAVEETATIRESILANHFTDGLSINLQNRIAARIRAISLATGVVDIRVYNQSGDLIGSFDDLPAEWAGHNYGFVATDGDLIGRIVIWEPGGVGYHGITYSNAFWRPKMYNGPDDFTVPDQGDNPKTPRSIGEHRRGRRGG